MGKKDITRLNSLEHDLRRSRDEWKRMHDRNLTAWMKEEQLSNIRFEGWTREYNKRKALEKKVEKQTELAKFWCNLHDSKDRQYTTLLKAQQAPRVWNDHCGAFSATLFREKIADLETKVREANVGNERLRFEIKDKTERYRAQRNQRIQDLEKENALLEGENRDLGSRILDLTKKLTAANDEVGRLVEKKYYSYYQG